MTKLTLGAGLALIIISLIAIEGCSNGKSEDTVEPERIPLEEFKNLFDNQADIVIVDTRSLEDYQAGHIPGAISMPYPDDIRARNQELPRDKTIILYCS
jgi:3-mercaptopyruvate sulfurtransferase SseA